jgi:hypothetical protein
MLGNVMFIGLHIPTVIGLILSLIGGLHLFSPNATTRSGALSLLKAGSLLSFVIFIFTALLGFWAFVAYWKALPSSNTRLLAAVVFAMPFLFVRYLYAVLNVFINRGDFIFYGGNVWIFLGMAVLPEFAIMALYLGAGSTTRLFREDRNSVGT